MVIGIAISAKTMRIHFVFFRNYPNYHKLHDTQRIYSILHTPKKKKKCLNTNSNNTWILWLNEDKHVEVWLRYWKFRSLAGHLTKVCHVFFFILILNYLCFGKQLFFASKCRRFRMENVSIKIFHSSRIITPLNQLYWYLF